MEPGAIEGRLRLKVTLVPQRAGLASMKSEQVRGVIALALGLCGPIITLT